MEGYAVSAKRRSFRVLPGVQAANQTEWKAKDLFLAIRLWYGVV